MKKVIKKDSRKKKPVNKNLVKKFLFSKVLRKKSHKKSSGFVLPTEQEEKFNGKKSIIKW